MIKTEIVKFGQKEFKRTYSDKGLVIQKIGTKERYSEAIDVLDSDFKYIETNKKAESEG